MCHRRVFCSFCNAFDSVNKKGNGRCNTDIGSDFWWKPRITAESFLFRYHFGMGQDILEASCLISMKPSV